MTITKAHAIEALYLIRTTGSPEAAAHDCSISLQAIEPYTDGRLSLVRTICRKVAEKPCRMHQLRGMAGEVPCEPYADATGAIHYRPAAVAVAR